MILRPADNRARKWTGGEKVFGVCKLTGIEDLSCSDVLNCDEADQVIRSIDWIIGELIERQNLFLGYTSDLDAVSNACSAANGHRGDYGECPWPWDT